MSKKVCFVTVIIIIGIVVILCFGLFCVDKAYDQKVVYPLSKVKNDGTSWNLSITKSGKEAPLLSISDNHILYNNRRDFKITLMPEVYMSTPGYFVKVFKNGKEIQSYPLFYLEQVEFGTIPRPNKQETTQGDGSVVLTN